MALRWFDGAEIWTVQGAGTKHMDFSYAAAAFVAGDTNIPRLSPGTAAHTMNDLSSLLTTYSLGLQNTWTIGFGFRSQTVSANGGEWRLLSGASTQCSLVVHNNGDDTFEMKVMVGATEIARTAQAFLPQVWHYFEFQVTARTGTNGSYELRYFERTLLSGTGLDMADTGVDGVDVHSFGYPENTATILWDDIYIADDQGATNNDFLGECVIVGRLPDGDGATTDFTPSAGVDNYAMVNDDRGFVDTTTYVTSTGTIGDKDLYTYDNLPLTGLAEIYAVRSVLDIVVATAGTHTVKLKFRDSDGSEADGSQVVVDSTSFIIDHAIFETHPVTGEPWARSDIDDGQFGLEVVS